MTRLREAQASPGERSCTIREVSDGWEAELHETRKARGSSALDALAQVSQTAAMENEETR